MERMRDEVRAITRIAGGIGMTHRGATALRRGGAALEEHASKPTKASGFLNTTHYGATEFAHRLSAETNHA